MPTNRLTQRRIDTLKPRRKTCDIRDSEIKGFGIRILPSGRKHYFLHSQIARIPHFYSAADTSYASRPADQKRTLRRAGRKGLVK